MYHQLSSIIYLISAFTVRRSLKPSTSKGPSTYDVHTEGEGVWLRWTHVDGGRGQAPCGRPNRNLKLESTDVILSSSHARKLTSFYQNFVFGRNKKWNVNIQSYSRISALDPEDYCFSRFTRVMCISC